MKKLVGSLSVLLALLSLMLAVGVLTGGAEGFAYVISGSMEPTLHVGDGFVLWPVRNPRVGDVVMYRPQVLKAKTVTHRIVAVAPPGFVTKGDHNLETDQAGGEPPVTRERIMGRAVAISGRILRIPRLGPVSEGVRDFLRRRLWVVAIATVGVSLLLGAVEQTAAPRRRQPRRRWRLGLVHRMITVGVVGGILGSMWMNAQVQQVEYLASMDPGDIPDHVPVGVPGSVRMKIANGGLLPVISFAEGIPPATADPAPVLLLPHTESALILQTPAHTEPGWYHDYVRVYRYPPLLPRPLLGGLHRRSPYLAMVGVASVVAALFWVPGLFINVWMPVRAMRDRRAPRVLRRILRVRPSRRRSV